MKDTKILLIESDKNSIFIITRLLHINCLDNLVIAKNGFDAVKKIKEESFDLILTELNVPGIDGLQITRICRQMSSYKDIPIVLITTQSFNYISEECSEAGVTNFIAKPIDKEVFIKTIKTHIKF